MDLYKGKGLVLKLFKWGSRQVVMALMKWVIDVPQIS